MAVLLEHSLLQCQAVMTVYSSNFLGNLILAWMVAVSLALVGYLLALKLREMRRNRTMDEQRERLGLRRVCNSMSSWLF